MVTRRIGGASAVRRGGAVSADWHRGDIWVGACAMAAWIKPRHAALDALLRWLGGCSSWPASSAERRRRQPAAPCPTISTHTAF